MENGIQRLFLTAAAVMGLGTMLATPVLAEESADTSVSQKVLNKIITPDMERRQIREAEMDTEDFAVGAYAGVMSVEDFGTNSVTGVRLAYHITEDFFMEAVYGQTTTEETSYEDLSGGVQLLTDDQRDLSYYNLSIGYNLFPGEIFIGKKYAFNSAFYVIGGVGNTDFAGEEHFTYNVGAGLRVLPTDWLSLHLDMRSHFFEHDLLGKDESIINLEAHLGFSVFF